MSAVGLIQIKMAEENINNEVVPVEMPVTEKTFLLSDGRTCRVVKGKGRHVMQATRVSDGLGDKFLYSMIALLTTIDGKGIVTEDLEDLPMADLLKIQTEFSELNF